MNDTLERLFAFAREAVGRDLTEAEEALLRAAPGAPVGKHYHISQFVSAEEVETCAAKPN